MLFFSVIRGFLILSLQTCSCLQPEFSKPPLQCAKLNSLLCSFWPVCVFLLTLLTLYWNKKEKKTLIQQKLQLAQYPLSIQEAHTMFETTVRHPDTLSWCSLSRQHCYSLPVFLALPSHFGANGPEHWLSPGQNRLAARLGQCSR